MSYCVKYSICHVVQRHTPRHSQDRLKTLSGECIVINIASLVIMQQCLRCSLPIWACPPQIGTIQEKSLLLNSSLVSTISPHRFHLITEVGWSHHTWRSVWIRSSQIGQWNQGDFGPLQKDRFGLCRHQASSCEWQRRDQCLCRHGNCCQSGCWGLWKLMTWESSSPQKLNSMYKPKRSAPLKHDSAASILSLPMLEVMRPNYHQYNFVGLWFYIPDSYHRYSSSRCQNRRRDTYGKQLRSFWSWTLLLPTYTWGIVLKLKSLHRCIFRSDLLKYVVDILHH